MGGRTVRVNLLRRLSAEYGAHWGARTHDPWDHNPLDHDPSWNQELNAQLTEPSRHPKSNHFKVNSGTSISKTSSSPPKEYPVPIIATEKYFQSTYFLLAFWHLFFKSTVEITWDQVPWNLESPLCPKLLNSSMGCRSGNPIYPILGAGLTLYPQSQSCGVYFYFESMVLVAIHGYCYSFELRWSQGSVF